MTIEAPASRSPSRRSTTRRCYAAAWPVGTQSAEEHNVELIVIEDGCRDGTPAFLEAESQSAWGQRHLRWIHDGRCARAAVHERRYVRRQGPVDHGLAGRHVRHRATGSCRSCSAHSGVHPDHRTDESEPRSRPLPLAEPIATMGRPGRLAAAAQHDRRSFRSTGFAFRKSMRSFGRGSFAARASIAWDCSTKPSCRRNGTRRTSPTASAKPGGESPPADTSGSAATTTSAAARSAT